MSHFVLDVTHIGEELVASLCNTQGGKEILGDLLNDKNFILDEALPNYNIQINNNLGDAKSQIDVALIGKGCCYAMELKLGSSIFTPGEYCKRYLNNPYHCNGDKFAGNMIPILARQGMENEEISIQYKNTKICVDTKWILMVRNEGIRKKLDPKDNSLQEPDKQKKWENMKKNCIIVSLQEFLSKLRAAKTDIESYIKSCITPPAGSSFEKEWGLNGD